MSVATVPDVPRGRLITIEGLDGAGKSTLARSLQREISELLPRVQVQLLREPGGVETSERIRDLVKDPTLSVSARTEALLYAAARAQLVEERIAPLLDRGAIVLLDRFVDSSLAYQGAGRSLGIDAIREINRFATGPIDPDRTLLLRISPAAGRLRLQDRGEQPDRLELEGEDFFTTIAAAYDEIARLEPGRIRVLGATLTPELLLSEAMACLEDLLQGPSTAH